MQTRAFNFPGSTALDLGLLGLQDAALVFKIKKPGSALNCYVLISFIVSVIKKITDKISDKSS